MEWKEIKHVESTDGKTEKIYCELIFNFPISQWNNKDKSPVIQLYYHDYKVEGGWWIGHNWYTRPLQKSCQIKFPYFQRMPEINLYSGVKTVSYEEFTLDFCKSEALKIFTNSLNDVLEQCHN